MAQVAFLYSGVSICFLQQHYHHLICYLPAMARRGANSNIPRAVLMAMGLRPQPVLRKAQQDGSGSGNGLAFGVAAMQGWRESMEDAHLALPDFDPERRLGIFGV